MLVEFNGLQQNIYLLPACLQVNYGSADSAEFGFELGLLFRGNQMVFSMYSCHSYCRYPDEETCCASCGLTCHFHSLLFFTVTKKIQNIYTKYKILILYIDISYNCDCMIHVYVMG